MHALHRGAFLQFPFRRIYYYGSNKSTGKETGKSHLCALCDIFFWHQEPQNHCNLNSLSDFNSLISSKNFMKLMINPGTKMTYPGLSMWVGGVASSKIHYFSDFLSLFLLEVLEAVL